MKTKSFFILLLMAAMCFYGCTKTVYVIEIPYTDTETPIDETDLDIDRSDDSNRVLYDDDYFSEPGNGTKENPYSVSQVIEIINSGECEYRIIRFVKGKVAYIKARGNSNGEWIIDYYISEDGEYADGACICVNDGTGFGGKLFSSRDALSEGDQVIAYGYLGLYGGLEMYDSKLYYLNGEYGDVGEYMEEGDGTKENPYAVWQALDIIFSDTFDPNRDYFVKGIVFSGGGSSNNSLMSYHITEDGGGLSGYGWGLYIYHGWGLERLFFSDDGLQRGDQVIVYGKFMDDDNIPIMTAGELYYLNGEYGTLYIHEHFMEPGDGTRENPYSVSQAVEAIDNSSYDPNKDYYVKGIIPSNGRAGASGKKDGDSWSYVVSYYISAGIGYMTEAETCLHIHNGTSYGGEKFDSSDVLSSLDEVVVYGKLTSSNGQPEMIEGQLVYLNGETAEDEN